ncbi:kelch-like protein 33 [Aulostomus maculatus]
MDKEAQRGTEAGDLVEGEDEGGSEERGVEEMEDEDKGEELLRELRNCRRSEDERIQQNQETLEEEANFSDPSGSETEKCARDSLNPEELKAPEWLKMAEEPCATPEDESTDDDEGETEDDHSDEENVVKIYCKDEYATLIFQCLTAFRDSSLLADLTLSTNDGKSFLVHLPVLAAVSSLVKESLSDGIDPNTNSGVHSWSMCLGPEVDPDGLEAIVEFAYTGHISHFSPLDKVKVAAQTLGAPRVLDLCAKEEEKSGKTSREKKEGSISAEEQMAISLKSIKQLWMDKVGCDVILEALGASLHVHRVILAASSDYFRGMFSLGMKESHQSRVTLPFLLASDLEALIGFSYSGVLPLGWSCVFELTSTSLQLQHQPALSLCLNFLQQEINPNSCLDVVSFAEAYEMEHLLEVANDFVLRQFQKVACTSKFKDLPAKQLLKYLSSYSLCVPSELVVFQAVVAWIQAKPKKRLKLAKELMKKINFPLMTFKEFREVQSLNMWSEHGLTELYESVVDDFCSSETVPQRQCRIYLPKESLVLIGGDQISEDLSKRSISRELWFGNSLMNHTGIKKAMEWRRLGETPEPPRFCHEVAVLKGLLYILGGKRYYGIGDTLNSAYRYDPVKNSWERLADMNQRRSSFSVVVLDGSVYAIGGHCDPDYIESVERYCPTDNSWSFVRPLDLSLSGHVAKVLQGQIFISGGLNSDYPCLASMFRYHPETGSIYLANMTAPRASHCMETLGDHLFVAGGITIGEPITIIDQLACEMYTPAADSWTAFMPLPVPHVGAGSSVLEGKFYVLGGYSQEDYSDTKMVHRYDPVIQRWENMGKMPGPNNDIRAVLLCLPPNVRL